MAWRPAPDTVLRVTGRLWSFVWVDNNQAPCSHRTGVGQIASTYTEGEPPYWCAITNEDVYVACVATESSGLELVYMSPVLPDGWPWGYYVWGVRWLHGG